jgi:hypothetical protein
MVTWVVCKISYDYFEFCKVLFAGSPTKVKSWLKENPQEYPVVFPNNEMPFEITHYPLDYSFNAGCKRYEPLEHILIREF